MITITIPKWAVYFLMFWLAFQIFASPLTQAFIKGLTGKTVVQWIEGNADDLREKDNG